MIQILFEKDKCSSIMSDNWQIRPQFCACHNRWAKLRQWWIIINLQQVEFSKDNDALSENRQNSNLRKFRSTSTAIFNRTLVFKLCGITKIMTASLRALYTISKWLRNWEIRYGQPRSLKIWVWQPLGSEEADNIQVGISFCDASQVVVSLSGCNLRDVNGPGPAEYRTLEHFTDRWYLWAAIEWGNMCQTRLQVYCCDVYFAKSSRSSCRWILKFSPMCDSLTAALCPSYQKGSLNGEVATSAFRFCDKSKMILGRYVRLSLAVLYFSMHWKHISTFFIISQHCDCTRRSLFKLFFVENNAPFILQSHKPWMLLSCGPFY